VFCSHLVAKVYSDSGIDVLDGYEPLKVTPGRLAKSKKFVDVTATTTYTPAHIPAHLVQSNFVTLSDQETARQEGIYQDLVPFFEARAIAVPNDWIKMLVFLADTDQKEIQRELDQEMLRVLAHNKYFDLAGEAVDLAISPLEQYISEKRFQSLSPTEVATDIRSLKQNLVALKRGLLADTDNADFYGDEFEKNKLKTFQLLSADKRRHCKLDRRVIELTEKLIDMLEEKAE
jgi:hypothetical protein